MQGVAALKYCPVALDENGARLGLWTSPRRNLTPGFPRASLEQLCHSQLDAIANPRLDLAVELVDEHQGHSPPLDNDIIARIEKRQVPTRCPQASCQRLLLQGQNPHVDEQAAISVLGQCRQGVCVVPLQVQHPLEGNHQGVGEPLRKLVEGLDAFRDSVGALAASCSSLQNAQRPRIANGRSGNVRAVLWPGGNEKCLENVPKDEDVEIGGFACLLGYQVVCGELSVINLRTKA